MNNISPHWQHKIGLPVFSLESKKVVLGSLFLREAIRKLIEGAHLSFSNLFSSLPVTLGTTACPIFFLSMKQYMLLFHDLLDNICMRPKVRKSAFLSIPSAIPQRLATASAMGEEHVFPCYANILPLSIVVCNRTITKWLQRLFQRGIISLCVIFSFIYFLIMM